MCIEEQVCILHLELGSVLVTRLLVVSQDRSLLTPSSNVHVQVQVNQSENDSSSTFNPVPTPSDTVEECACESGCV